MSVPSAGQFASHRLPTYEVKSAQLPLVALVLRSADWELVAQNILKEFGPEGESPDFFDHDALVIDFSHLDAATPVDDLVPLLKVLRQCNLVPVAVRGASPQWTAKGLELGLVEAPIEVHHVRHPEHVPVVSDVVHEVIREVVREVPGPSTMVVDKPLRSGQKVYARGADLVVLAMVNQGAEVVADGNIHVYAPLRGKAMAGARGNTSARIFSLCLEPELVSIAGVYRTSENSLPEDIQGKPAQIRLSNDGQEKLLIEALSK
ncbi:MAG: septum site-determining protein MinC [Rhodoferax sp.]|nr:septum site-determining protein MinC [Rhodoferax sp.]MCF8209318.1 septum site-determining protein MinC [Rhodoferax sp.]